MKRSLKSIFTEIHPDDAATGPWSLIIIFTLLGAMLTILMGYVFFSIFHEKGNIIPPMIFSGLMTLAGAFLFLGGLVEAWKKVASKVIVV